MTGPAFGSPFRNHRTQAEIMGLSGPAPLPLSKQDALIEVIRSSVLAEVAIQTGSPLAASAHLERADRFARDYGVAWEDPVLVRSPLQERQA